MDRTEKSKPRDRVVGRSQLTPYQTMKRILILWLASSFASFGAVQYSFTNLAGLPGYFNSGTNDGTGRAARFSYPIGVAVDSAGNVYIADSGNNAIEKWTCLLYTSPSPRD